MSDAAPFELHLLNAAGQLRPVVSFLQTRIRAAHEEACRPLPLGPLDIVARAGSGVVAGKGHIGWTPSAHVIYVTVDPDDPDLLTDRDRSFERLMAHEFHHAARWAGPGYGSTLGAALVTEGLACRFVREVYGPPPEPWETSVGSYELKGHAERAIAEWDRPGYDHASWFHGAGDLPDMLGYALGAWLADRYFDAHPDESAAGSVHASADQFRPT